MQPLAITFFLPVVEGVFIFRHHFLLSRHLVVPSRKRLHRTSVLLCVIVILQGLGDNVEGIIDGPEPLALTSFLRGGKPPWCFPVREEKRSDRGGICGRMAIYVTRGDLP